MYINCFRDLLVSNAKENQPSSYEEQEAAYEDYWSKKES